MTASFRRSWLASTLLVMMALAAALLAAPPPPIAPMSFDTLEPRGFRTLTQQLPINIVFVGYEPGAGTSEIDESAFRAGLPDTYCAQKRIPAFYGLRQPAGLCFEFDYHVTFASDAFENAFFGHLASLAVARPLTFQQQQYNIQPPRSLTITDNHRIDAAAVESWLGSHGGDIGVDTSRYTVFFVNWYGRPDFRFHVYDYRAEPDPDTGHIFGARDSRAMIAWGGSDLSHRVWFYDLSAGPESWTANYDLTRADLDSNGIMDYRMPPVWEYGNLSGYRPFDDLSGDLGKIARYVALNLLFTTSPLYDPAITSPKLPQTIQVDISVFADSGPPPADYLKPPVIAAKLNALQPLHQFTAEFTSGPLSGRIGAVYDCFIGYFFGGGSCFGNRLFNIAFADLFLYFYESQLLQYLEGEGDYEVPVFYFYSSKVDPIGLGGFADDNWRDGTQTYIAAFDSDFFRSLGFGGTATVTHEVGHHVGMSHPHDGYDHESDIDYSPFDDFFFAWSGDESQSVMSYLSNAASFSRFDRDNMARYLTATYINHANRILADVLDSPRAPQVASQLAQADAAATEALGLYDVFNYAGAAARAKSAFAAVLAAAAAINVHVEPQSWQADYRAKGRSPKFVDTIDERRRAR